MNSLRNPPFSVGDSVEARLRGKHHWYPATIVRVELEGEEDHQWRFTINYTDGFRDLHYPPPPPPLLEKGVEPRQLRMLREHGALTNLFDECGGAAKSRRDKGWGRRSGWDREAVAKMKKDARPFYEDIEQWDGVSMTNGRLSHLHLQTNNLRGKLPKTIWPCDFLVELNLASNGISGSIPPSVSKLRSLKWLDLSSNALAGRIPRSLGGCAKLQVLDLSHNQLAGPLPSTLGRLLGLKECHLQDNQLNGEVPLTLPEAIRFCEELSLFDVSHNEGLEGVEHFRDAMRRYLPMCATFVGSPQVTDTHSIQSFAVKAERPPTATALKPLSEATWEDEFSPSWELG